MDDSRTLWVRFVNQTEGQAEKFNVSNSGDVGDLRAAVANEFGLLRTSFTLGIGQTELSNIPQGTVVVTVHGQKRKFEDEIIEKLDKLEQGQSKLEQDITELKVNVVSIHFNNYTFR